jgi:hypothetical protein
MRRSLPIGRLGAGQVDNAVAARCAEASAALSAGRRTAKSLPWQMATASFEGRRLTARRESVELYAPRPAASTPRAGSSRPSWDRYTGPRVGVQRTRQRWRTSGGNRPSCSAQRRAGTTGRHTYKIHPSRGGSRLDRARDQGTGPLRAQVTTDLVGRSQVEGGLHHVVSADCAEAGERVAVALLQALGELPTKPAEESATFKRVRQARRLCP